MVAEIRTKLRSESVQSDPGELFASSHPELGYAHNLAEWKAAHAQLVAERKEGLPRWAWRPASSSGTRS